MKDTETSQVQDFLVMDPIDRLLVSQDLPTQEIPLRDPILAEISFHKVKGALNKCRLRLREWIR